MSEDRSWGKSSLLMYIYLLIAVIAFGILCVWQIPKYVDVLGWDEGLYMQNGLLFDTKLQKQWGPVYAAWYYLLHLFQFHPLKLYLLNFQVLTLVPGILFYIYWTRLKIRPLIAAIIAMFFIASHINFYSWPNISLFTVVVLLSGFIVATYFKDAINKLLIVAGGVIIASYMRPELYLGYIVLVFIAIFLLIKKLIKKQKIERGTWGLLSILMIGTIGLQKWLGNPLFNFEGEGGRAVAAFGQHFAYNYTIWNHLRPDRWQLHAAIIIEEVFGSVENIGEAIKANPQPIYHHFYSNITHFLVNTWKFYTDIFIPESIFHLNAVWRTVILSIVVFSLYFKKAFSLKLWWSRFKRFGIDWFMLVIVTGPTLISVILIFPREHYMVLQVAMLLTFILSFSYGFTGWENISKTRNYLGLISAIVLALLIFAPNPKDRPYFDNFRDPKGNFNVQAANILENFELLKDTISISEDEGGIICFIPTKKANHYKWTPALRKENMGFDEYADSLQTQLYYITPLMLYDDRYFYDEEWQYFLKNYREKGFEKRTIADEWYFLYDTTALK